MNRRKLCLVLMWMLTLAWTALLFGFSGQDARDSADLSMKLTAFILNLFPNLNIEFDALHHIVRKTAHFGIFAVEGALLFAALKYSGVPAKRAFLFCLPVCAALAGLNEYHQSFAEGRHPSAMDACIDTAGSIAGIALSALIAALLRRKNAKLS